MNDSLLLGIDVGTGGVRVAVITPDGELVSSAATEVRTYTPRPAHAEQNPEDWWRGLKLSLEKVLCDIDRERIVGIAVDATSATLVACDNKGKPLRPALLWMDVRSAKQSEMITNTGDPALKYSGQQIVSAEWGVPKLMWLKQNEPQTYNDAEVFVDCVDWMNYKLTGLWRMSICSATCKFFYDSNWSGWPTNLYAAGGIVDALGKLPSTVMKMGEVIGGLSSIAAKQLGLPAGIPVAMGGIDAHVGAVGVGVVEPGSLALITGSSHVMLGQSDSAIYSKGLWGSYYDAIIPGQYTVEAGQISSGSINQWFTRNFTLSAHKKAQNQETNIYRILDEVARKIPIGSDGLVVLDHFQGNRSPFSNPYSRGAITGLTLGHGEGHIYRAVLEGVCYGTKTIFDRMREKGLDPVKVMVSGGPTKSEFWMQMHADVTGVPMSIPSNPEGPLLGSAILAAVGASLYGDIREAASSMVSIDRTIEPSMEAHEEYKFFHERYMEIYKALAPVSESIARKVSA
ncbi:FGGY-family carbohydrate kinase [Gleimia hominis]|uniref:FGGY-family carbohydrate kinase n=1 Tax=Gleimia hominis TaxID=595468 RepID=UPI000C7FBD74|nr:FGGY-family carbohydrate kinase [Gleimia hominis]WIK63827.1 FGGY-family carbohydrate kinase [Gleimia hominis]